MLTLLERQHDEKSIWVSFLKYAGYRYLLWNYVNFFLNSKGWKKKNNRSFIYVSNIESIKRAE